MHSNCEAFLVLEKFEEFGIFHTKNFVNAEKLKNVSHFHTKPSSIGRMHRKFLFSLRNSVCLDTGRNGSGWLFFTESSIVLTNTKELCNFSAEPFVSGWYSKHSRSFPAKSSTVSQNETEFHIFLIPPFAYSEERKRFRMFSTERSTGAVNMKDFFWTSSVWMITERFYSKSFVWVTYWKCLM